VELIAVVVWGAVRISGALHTVGMDGLSINATLEFIAMLASGAGAVSVASAIGDGLTSSGLSINASLELIAVLTSGAGAIGIAGAIRNGAIGSWGTWDAEMELIAVVVWGAVRIGGALHTVGMDGLSSDASLEFVTVVASGAGAVRGTSISKGKTEEHSHGEGDFEETSHSLSLVYINNYNSQESFIFL